MRSHSKALVMTLALTLLTGCTHKTKATPPPAAQAPVAPVSTLAKETPPPQLPPPEPPAVSEAPANTPPPPKPHKTVHHKPKVETAPVEQASAKEQTAPPATTEQAANGGATDMSPIGQLSAAGESTNTPRRHEILDEINSTENTLNNIKRPLSSDEQTTATQIRTFLAKAKGALSQEDLDAAHSLVTRAKVLLDELTKP